MAYPNDGQPLELQILEALRVMMAGIQPPDYFTAVATTQVWETAEARHGMAYPAIYIVPVNDTFSHRTCAQIIEYVWSIGIFFQLKSGPQSVKWKDPLLLLKSDIRMAVERDPQLGGLARKLEIQDVDLYDAQVSEGIAEGVATLRVQYAHPNLEPHRPV